MAEQWEGMLEGAAQELKGHLTLDRVTANRSGDEITVYFSADVLVEERPFKHAACIAAEFCADAGEIDYSFARAWTGFSH